MQPAFIIERTTRTMDRRLGTLSLNAEVVLEMATAGQGLVIGCCERTDIRIKIARAVKNALPSKTLICCHSYESADEVAEQCNEFGVNTALLFSDYVTMNGRAIPDAIATVPECLPRFRLRKEVKGFVPTSLFLVDPAGLTFRARGHEWGGGNRAAMISTFRAYWLARGHAMFPVAWLNGSPAAYVADNVCASLGVEAVAFGDARTLRTAFSDADATPQVSETLTQPTVEELENELDAPVSKARQRRVHLFLHVDVKQSTKRSLLAQLADLRKYPRVSLKPFLNGVSRQPSLASLRERGEMNEVAAQLSKTITLVNKQVVLLEDVEGFYRRAGPRTAMFILARAAGSSLLLAPAPNDLTSKDVKELFDDICRIAPKTERPEIYTV